GILNMIQELSMKNHNDCHFSCVVQYIIFPSHTITASKESLSDDEESELTEDDGELQLITECWVEPQNGVSFDCNNRNKFLEGLDYKEISQSFYAIDLEAISCLLTFEQTLILCQNDAIESPIDDIPVSNTESPQHNLKHSTSKLLGTSTPDIPLIMPPIPKSERIKTNKYCYDIMGLLSKSQQAVVLFSTLFQELRSGNTEDTHSVNFSDSLQSIPLLSTSTRICDDEITYLGYFSTHKTMILQILQDKANNPQTQLTEDVETEEVETEDLETEEDETAAIDCRREHLWTCLLPRKTNNSESDDTHLTITEFDELLSLVDTMSLSQYDPRLVPFTCLHLSWYQSLAKTLVHKIGMNYRNFSSSDMKSIKLVFSQSSCLDCFILLNINANTSLAEICLVFKKQMTNKTRESFLESYTQCHTLVEEFINGCAYYMWSAIP
ncbi:unnamed protein product, partial [Oppiella nova]